MAEYTVVVDIGNESPSSPVDLSEVTGWECEVTPGQIHPKSVLEKKMLLDESCHVVRLAIVHRWNVWKKYYGK